jgi:hypothetical protein
VEERPTTEHKSLVRAVAWAGVAFAAIAVPGLVFARNLLILWAILLVFGAIAVPQILLLERAETRKREKIAARKGRKPAKRRGRPKGA